MSSLGSSQRTAIPRRLTAWIDPTCHSDGAGALRLAALHKRPALPWQRDVAVLAGQLRPDGTARHPLVVIVVPRQVGKTTIIQDIALARLLSRPQLTGHPYHVAYSAQTGHQTTARMSDRMSELSRGPLASRFRLRRSQGTERITEIRSGSTLRAFPPIADALRGDTLDCVILDEAQSHGDELGHALDATVLPTMTTRRQAQLIVVGTAGRIPGSEFLRRYVDRAAADPDALLVEYGAPEDVEDDSDEDMWMRVHPGLAAGLTTVAYLRSVRATSQAAFRREFLSLWQIDTDSAAAAFIDLDAWEAAADPGSAPADQLRWHFAAEIARERDRASICAAVRLEDGRVHLELVDQRAGTAWLPRRIADLRARRPGSVWHVDASGPSATLSGEPGIQPVTGGTSAAWHGLFRDAASSGRIIHRGQPGLDAAVRAATVRMLGDKSVIARRSDSDVTPVLAGAIAAAAAMTQPAAQRPMLITS